MSWSFSRFGGLLGILAGVAGLLYLIFFVTLKNPAALPSALSLLLVGIFASAVLVALYQQVREIDEGFALWGLLLGIGGAGGAAVHSAFDLADNLHPPTSPFTYASPVDPRGFLTFAIAGLAALVLSWLIVRGAKLPRALGYLGVASGLLLILLYIAYLVILDANNPLVLVLILLSGLIQPIWYLWLGWSLWQGQAYMPAAKAAARR
jgi:hypothetical protein